VSLDGFVYPFLLHVPRGKNVRLGIDLIVLPQLVHGKVTRKTHAGTDAGKSGYPHAEE
jgi:hypothetical protein